jgi:Mrp family chromosome partitioning ATPase
MLDVIKKLKNVYDIIIIDTPSVCIDKERAKALAFADVTLYVLRANVTKKDIINDLDSFALLLNDVR